MEAYFPWILVAVSGAGLYTEHLVRELRARVQQAAQSGHPKAAAFPAQFLEIFSERMASKKLHLWALLVAGICWGFLDLL
jgi:hypothetical protein